MSRDWKHIFSWHILFIPAVVLMTMFSLALADAKNGRRLGVLASLGIGVIGAAILLFAWLLPCRKGVCSSLGSGKVTSVNKRLYWIACTFIGSSILITTLLFLL